MEKRLISTTDPHENEQQGAKRCGKPMLGRKILVCGKSSRAERLRIRTENNRTVDEQATFNERAKRRRKTAEVDRTSQTQVRNGCKIYKIR